MNTLHTFGCSLTATEVSHWTKRLAEDLNYRINNCAVPAGDNLTQCRRFKDLVLRNKVQKGDYILWEVTYLNRLGFRLSQDHNFYLDNKDNPDVNHNFHTHLPNLIDNTYHNDYVAFNEKWYNTNWQMQNINEMLTSLLYHFTVAKNLVNNNILIWFADHIFENEIQQNNFIKYLDRHDIKHVDYTTQSLMPWISKNGHALGVDQMHPADESYDLYYKEFLKLKMI